MARAWMGTRAAIVCAIVALTGVVHGAEPAAADITGIWLVESGEARIELAPCGDGLCGTVVWMREPFDEDGNEKRDIFNPDESLRGRKVVGLRIMEVHRKPGKLSWKGRIYDANKGNTYRCTLESQSENLLKFRGYIGISLFGRTSYWTRVPVLSTYSAEPILGKNSSTWTARDSCRMLHCRATIGGWPPSFSLTPMPSGLSDRSRTNASIG
jgi:uncharacterized protein (DUF2147 family)